MKLYDISQELFSCKVFPGDPKPEKQILCTMEDGSPFFLTSISMCSHNGTHVDAPSHFLQGGKTIEQIPLEPYIGDCYVARHQGEVTGQDAEAILAKARSAGAPERILIAGDAFVSEQAAVVFAAQNLKLLGNESQTVGPEDAPMAVHKILLAKQVVLLEGVVLRHVPEGKYFLSAAPLNLGGCEGSPCRAVLIRADEDHQLTASREIPV